MKFVAALTILLASSSLLAKEIHIRHKDIQGRVGFQHIGSCEKNPTLLIEQMDRGSLTTSMTGPPKLSDFVVYAFQAANLYARNCPDLSTIRFAITPMPDDSQCIQGDECFIEFDWEKTVNNPRNQHHQRTQQARPRPTTPSPNDQLLDVVPDGDTFNIARRQFSHRFIVPAIRSADDMTEVLAAGRFDLIRGNKDQNYAGLFSYYFSNFITSYSQHCSRHIKDPVKRTISFDKHEYNRSTNRTEVIKDENPLTFTMDASLVNDFDRNHAIGTRWAFASGISRIAGGNVQSATEMLLGTGHQISRFVATDCVGDHVQTVYSNMLAYSRGQSPITGKYTTSKVLESFKENPPNSAPEFVASYIKERERRINSATEDIQNERRKVLTQEISFSHIAELNELELAAHKIQSALVNYMMIEAATLQRAGRSTEAKQIERLVGEKLQELNTVRNARRAQLLAARGRR